MASAKELLKRLAALKSAQTPWTSIWSDCARYCQPNAAPLKVFGKIMQGDPKNQPLDITGESAATKLAAWLYSSTVYQGEDWFSLKARRKSGGGDYDFNDNYALTEWLQKAARAALDCISPSNFIKIYQQSLLGYTTFGTAVIYVDFNADGELVCKYWDITDSVYIAEDADGEIDTVFREFEYTARQAVQEFGFENLSEDIKKAYEKESDKDKLFKFAHCVYPREKRFVDASKRLPKYKKYASVYIEVGRERIVENGGTDTFPYCVPRFYNNGEVYGRSPAMSALPALKALNMETYIYVENTRAQGKPVVFAPTQIADDIDLTPGATNPYNSDEGQIVLWSSAGDSRSSLDFIERVKADVREIFYNDVFQYLEDRKNMTATEAQLRYDEMIQGISPVLANLQNDLFKRFILRVVVHLIKSGKLDVPAEFTDGDGKTSLPEFDIVYTSRLDTKIKGVQNADLLNCLRMLAEVFQYAEMPQMAARVDFGKIAQKIIANNNVAELGILYDDDTVTENLQNMAEQQQQAQIAGLIKPIDAQKTPAQGSMQAMMTEGVGQ